MNPSLEALATTLLWSETDNADETGGEPLDKNYSVSDINSDSLDELRRLFERFVQEAEEELTKQLGSSWGSIDDFYIGSGTGSYQTEYHFILTANGHGCGFWEKSDWQEPAGSILTELAKKYAEIHAYVGDDGKVHLGFPYWFTQSEDQQ